MWDFAPMRSHDNDVGENKKTIYLSKERQRPETPLEAVKSCSENPPAASLCKPGRTRSQGWLSPHTGTPPEWHHE